MGEGLKVTQKLIELVLRRGVMKRAVAPERKTGKPKARPEGEAGWNEGEGQLLEIQG